MHIVAADAGGASPADLADFLLGTLHGLRLDGRLVLEIVGLIGIAVVAIQRPIQRGGTGWAQCQQPQSIVAMAHDVTPKISNASASKTVPVASAANSSFHCCTGTLPMVSPVRPFTAM